MLHELALATIRLSTPLLLAAMGGAVTYQAGMLNIALDGFMIVSAFTSIATAYATGSLAIGILAGVASATVVASLLAAFNLKFRADIFIAGIAVTFLAYGLTGLLLQGMLGQDGVFSSPLIPRFPALVIPLIANVPIIGSLISGQTLLVYIAFLSVPVVAWCLYRTRWGLRLRLAGQAPDAAEAAGINVGSLKTQAMLLSGVFCGLAGAYLSLGYVTLFARQMTNERGLIALAAIFFAKGRPFRTAIVVLLFGLTSALSVELPQSLRVAPELLQLIPYVITIMMLALVGIGSVRRRKKFSAWRFIIE